MTHYTVSRSGPAGHFQLYAGGLRWRAVETFARALPEKGTVVTLSRGREVLRRSDEVVIVRCWLCAEPIDGDLAPAVDSSKGLPVCPSCVSAQRHARAVVGGAR
jgi:hypothetical protein